MEDGLAETGNSIAEATKSAAAMEGIAASLAANVVQLREAMEINKQIAATNHTAMIAAHRPVLEIDEMSNLHSGTNDATNLTLRFRLFNASNTHTTVSEVRRWHRVGLPWADGQAINAPIIPNVFMATGKGFHYDYHVGQLTPEQQAAFKDGRLIVRLQMEVNTPIHLGTDTRNNSNGSRLAAHSTWVRDQVWATSLSINDSRSE